MSLFSSNKYGILIILWSYMYQRDLLKFFRETFWDTVITLNIFCQILALENQFQRLQADKSICNDVKLYCCIHITSLLQKVFLTFRSQSRLKTCRFFKGVQIIYNVLVFIRLTAAAFIRFFLIRLRRLFKCGVYKSAAFIF